MLRLIYLLLALPITLYATNDIKPKQKLNCDMTLQYQKTPKEHDSLVKALAEGIFYGRLRFHHFSYNGTNKEEDHQMTAFGGSLIYKSGYLNGFGITTALYTTHNPWHISREKVSYYRSGKDTLSRYNVATKGDYSLTSLAQIYLEYKDKKSLLKIGRQRFESFLAKSNDTKMIPNTFEGLSLETKLIPDTRIRMALFTKQKLRDHDEFHHILAYGDRDKPYAQWLENDDGSMHRGLTLSKLKEHDINDQLFILDIKNKSLSNGILRLNYTAVPDLISSFTLEGVQCFNIERFKIIPALRIMRQFDIGAGAIGGANLSNNTIGYQDADNLDSRLIATRIDFIQDAWSLRFGYSSIQDKGDIIAPWRGFPTASYTRAMGQRNWYANTDTFLARFDYNLGRAGIIPAMHFMTRYTIQDFDDDKPGVPSDSRVWTVNLVKKGFFDYQTLYGKLRFAHINSDDDTIAIDRSLKPNNSYSEVRLEVNYLF